MFQAPVFMAHADILYSDICNDFFSRNKFLLETLSLTQALKTQSLSRHNRSFMLTISGLMP